MSKLLTRRTLLQSTAAGVLLLTPGILTGCAKTGTVPPLPGTQPDELLALLEIWAAHFGYYDGQINLDDGDLSTFTTPDCALTAHAPLWGTKEGEERAVPAAEVRRSLARMTRWTRIERHNMHIARHPSADAACLFFEVKARLVGLPFTLMRVSLAFVANAERTDAGLRLQEIHEWPAESPEAARVLLIDQLGWPDETVLTPHMAFGALS